MNSSYWLLWTSSTRTSDSGDANPIGASATVTDSCSEAQGDLFGHSPEGVEGVRRDLAASDLGGVGVGTHAL